MKLPDIFIIFHSLSGFTFKRSDFPLFSFMCADSLSMHKLQNINIKSHNEKVRPCVYEEKLARKDLRHKERSLALTVNRASVQHQTGFHVKINDQEYFSNGVVTAGLN